jgi:hypothetical protein
MQDHSLNCALFVCMFMYDIIRIMDSMFDNEHSGTIMLYTHLYKGREPLLSTTSKLRQELPILFSRLRVFHKFMGSIEDPELDHFSSNVLTRIQASSVTDLDSCSNMSQAFALGMHNLVSKRNTICHSINKVSSKRTKFGHRKN